MEIIDSQVHCWDRDAEPFPWYLDAGSPERNAMVRAHFTEHVVTMDELIARMDAAGVHAGVSTVPSIYGFDNGYALAAVRKYPERLAMVALVDPNAPDMEARVVELGRTPGVLGVRVMVFTDALLADIQRGARRRLLAALQKHGVTFFIYPPRYLQHVKSIASEFPGLRIVVDHLGFPQPPVNISGAGKEGMFHGWEHLIDLAHCPNVAIKMSAFPSMSAQKYPFLDLWPRIEQLIDAWGLDRLFWGTDFTRVESMHSYREAVDYLKLSDRLTARDKARLMGGSLRRYFNWPGPNWVPRTN